MGMFSKQERNDFQEERNNKRGKKNAIRNIIIVVIIVFLGSRCSVSEKDSMQTPEQSSVASTESNTLEQSSVASTESNTPEQDKTSEEEKNDEETEGKEEKSYTADVESIEQLATDLFSFEYEELSATYDEADEAFVIQYRPVNVSSVEGFAYKNVNRYIHFCQVAYEIEGIERIRFDVYLLGQDQYGQDYEIEGMSILMVKENFDKFNWENLSYMNIWDTFTSDSYIFEIAPQIIDDVDTSKVFYDPYTRKGGLID